MSTPLMDPAIGRALWQMLHSFARGYPFAGTMETRALASNFLASFRDNLLKTAAKQCPCRTVMYNAMLHFPPPLTGRDDFVTWCEALHEVVNLKLQKPRFRPSLQHPMLTHEAWQKIIGNLAPNPF